MSRAQVTRLIGKQRKTGSVTVEKCNHRIFPKIYSDQDIWLLATTDELHDFPNGVMIKKILGRMFKEYRDPLYKNISNISVGHIYNLRKSIHYQRLTKKYEKTKPRIVILESEESRLQTESPDIYELIRFTKEIWKNKREFII